MNNSDVCVDDDYPRWFFANKSKARPCPELAAAYEEWADYFEWRLTQRAAELADDPAKRRLATSWTVSMAHSSRRLAAWARGENPGKWPSPDELSPAS